MLVYCTPLVTESRSPSRSVGPDPWTVTEPERSCCHSHGEHTVNAAPSHRSDSSPPLESFLPPVGQFVRNPRYVECPVDSSATTLLQQWPLGKQRYSSPQILRFQKHLLNSITVVVASVKARWGGETKRHILERDQIEKFFKNENERWARSKWS